jgi:putative PEP-CTERM system histidine kinase
LLLYGQISSVVELSRGLVNLAVVPFVMAASRSRREWQARLFVSRQVVLYTTSLISAGFYLLAMAVAGHMVAASGHAWGPVLEVVFLLSAGALFLYGLFSSALRMHLKVLVAKHFFRSRYDYRREWLRLIHTLAGLGSDASLRERSVKALADIVGSPRGELWLKSETGARFDSYGTWGMPAPARGLEANEPLVQFLERTRWVIDTKEYLKDPEKYMHAFASDSWPLAAPAVFVPLLLDQSVIGIVRLHQPPLLGQLGFEDHDLLKTAGQQVAIFLAQERAQEALAAARQFEAFNKLTSFLMHDLKNLIAQQELVVGNARRFKHRPEFVEDVIETISAGVRRMKNVLERLQSAGAPETVSRIDVKRLVTEVCASCADRVPVATLVHAVGELRVTMNRDKLAMAITHAIRNAQDATPVIGSIEVRLNAMGRTVCIEVRDTGVGMAPDFVRDHLFKPFDSTKGTKGMGIGAYQIRETLRAAGGDVDVESVPGEGTIVRMTLPATEDLSAAERSVA